MEFKELLSPMAVVASFLAILAISSASFDNTTFNFLSFSANQQGIQFAGDASFDKDSIQLTTSPNGLTAPNVLPSPNVLPNPERVLPSPNVLPNPARVHPSPNGLLPSPNGLTSPNEQRNMNYSAGWATYFKPMHLWDRSTGNIANFSTRFSFIIDSKYSAEYADGFTFFLAPNGSQMPGNTAGGYFGLPSSVASDKTNYPFIAVEFDTFSNTWDPGYAEPTPTGYAEPRPPGYAEPRPPCYAEPRPPCYAEPQEHIGIDVTSVKSAVTKPWAWAKIMSGGQAEAWITYDSSARNLSVKLVDESDPNNLGIENKGISSLSHPIDLSRFLPEWVIFGFSGSTGYNSELHKIVSWEFNSSLQIADPVEPNPSPSPPIVTGEKKNKTWVWVTISCAGAIVLFITIAVIAWFHRLPKEEVECANEKGDGNAVLIDEELERMAGPKKFSYNELAIATGDFSVGRLLGEGGFGKVYEGYLSGMENRVAVKKITTDSKQGMLECAVELKAVSQLRHRSLVQLFGWSHRDKELLLVYEFMSNGSLDSHLFKHKTLLTWEARYRIAQDLASATLYLHEEWAKCVLHRDIKCSNIMLDSSFNAKLGDLGLARLVDHGKGSQTTMLAGTMGYLAPECMSTGRASKESDVYSFGVVALEIACGRRVIEPRAEEGQFQLVCWVWELYGTGKLLDAADPVLEGRYDMREIELLMTVGLWCAHPDRALRPSILEALHVLKFKGSLPALPLKMPVPTYASPPNMPRLSLSIVSSGSTNSKDGTSYTTKSSTWTSSSNASTSSPSALLLNTH